GIKDGIKDGIISLMGEDIKKVDIIKAKHGQMMIFSDDRVQRIFYTSRLGTQKKTLANVSSVEFFFSQNRGFALMTKATKGGKTYSLETFTHDMITTNNIDAEIKKIKVADEAFVTYDTNKNVTFYKLDKFNFRKIKQVQKEDDCVISVSGSMFCIFDGETENIEFYDGGDLRSVYSHQACTNIIWSETGLNCASISRSTGLTQLYNCNGKLFWKKIYNRILNFQWRPFHRLSKEEKNKLSTYSIEKYKKGFESSSGAESNLDELISEWKSFLVGKRNLLTKNLVA
ncbi:Eukaryotic translation initiation factor 3 subunit B, partial [Nosema granulosis]